MKPSAHSENCELWMRKFKSTCLMYMFTSLKYQSKFFVSFKAMHSVLRKDNFLPMQNWSCGRAQKMLNMHYFMVVEIIFSLLILGSMGRSASSCSERTWMGIVICRSVTRIVLPWWIRRKQGQRMDRERKPSTSSPDQNRTWQALPE